MLVLVLGANFLVMFVGWEGVGLCSYLLIGFWYQKKSASDAGQESLHRQPHRRLRVHSRHAAAVGPLRHPRLPGDRPRPGAAQPGGDVRHAVVDHAAAVRRRHRQVGADPALRLAAGRDGGSDPGLGPDPCGDDGHRRRLHDWPQRRPVQSCAGDADDRRRHRRRHRADGGHHRPGAERHQARARVLDRVAARIHVPGDGRRRLRGRHLPSLHPRVLQGAVVPGIGCGDSRAGGGAGPAADGRSQTPAADHLLDLRHRRGGDRRGPGPGGILQQGRDSVPHLCQRSHRAVGDRRRHVAVDGDLHVPSGAPGLSRRTCPPSQAGTRTPDPPARRTRHASTQRPARFTVTSTTRRRRWRWC